MPARDATSRNVPCPAYTGGGSTRSAQPPAACKQAGPNAQCNAKTGTRAFSPRPARATRCDESPFASMNVAAASCLTPHLLVGIVGNLLRWGQIPFTLGCGGGSIDSVKRSQISVPKKPRLTEFIIPPPHLSVTLGLNSSFEKSLSMDASNFTARTKREAQQGHECQGGRPADDARHHSRRGVRVGESASTRVCLRELCSFRRVCMFARGDADTMRCSCMCI